MLVEASCYQVFVWLSVCLSVCKHIFVVQYLLLSGEILVKLAACVHYASGKSCSGCQVSGQGSRSSALCISKSCECDIFLARGDIVMKLLFQLTYVHKYVNAIGQRHSFWCHGIESYLFLCSFLSSAWGFYMPQNVCGSCVRRLFHLKAVTCRYC